jgi:DNA-binding MarR family transcriptional regulator
MEIRLVDLETSWQDTGPVREDADAIDRIVSQWQEQLPGVDAGPLQVLGRIQRIEALADALLRPPLAAAGLASGDFDVLAALRRDGGGGGLSPTALAAAMLVTRGAITKRVDRLLAAGLVTRRPAGQDARAKLIALTPGGRRLTDTLIRRHLQAEADLLSCLSQREASTLTDLLRVLLQNLEGRDLPSGPGPPH